MKIGFSNRVITPPLGTEMVGYLPARKSTGIDRDLMLKVLTLHDQDQKQNVWLTVDMLGLDVFFREQVLEYLKAENIHVDNIQMFSTHTHSGPICLNAKKYPEADEDAKAYFDFLVSQAKDAIIESIALQQNFQYRIANGTMANFQTNRIDPKRKAQDELRVLEVLLENNEKALLYSFSGHPTILDASSTLISPDYVGVVAEVLSDYYEHTMFFNAPCGDMSTRYTKKESSLSEVERLGSIAAKHVLETTKRFEDYKELKHYANDTHIFKIKLKDFDTVEYAQNIYDVTNFAYREALEANTDKITLRQLRAKLEGHMISLYHSKQNYEYTEYPYEVGIIQLDEFKIVTLSSEVFTSLVRPINNKTTWTISLAHQYRTYLCDEEAHEDFTYEGLASIYKKGEAEKLMQKIQKLLKA